MHKRILSAVIAATLLTASNVVFADDTANYQKYNIQIPDITFDVDAVVEEGEVYLPLRTVAEQVNAEVQWDEKNKIATINTDKEIKVQIDKKMMYKNQYKYDLNNNVKLFDGMTYVPVEVVERIINCKSAVGDSVVAFAKSTDAENTDNNGTISVIATEDTYVRCGDAAEKNFGESYMLTFCKDTSKPELYQRAYMKFDLSDIPTDGLKKVYFMADMQKDAEYFFTGHRTFFADAFEVGYDSWSESTLTFNTQPVSGDKAFTVQAQMNAEQLGRSNYATDVTEYFKNAIENGKTKLSFVFDGLQRNRCSVFFSSHDNPVLNRRTRIVFDYEDKASAVDTSVYEAASYGNGIKPIDYAKEMIETSTATYSKEKQGTVAKRVKIDKEYNEIVDAWTFFDRKWEPHVTRTMSSLEGYTPVTKDPKLSQYGGDKNRKYDEGTGYFRVEKVDGRWWFVDPDGYLMYAYGKANVRPDDNEEYYKTNNITDDASKLRWANEQRDYYKNNLKFNCLGGWSYLFRPLNGDGTFAGELDLAATTGENNMPFGSIRCYGTSIQYGKTIDVVEGSGVETFKGQNLPVFNPDFEEKCDRIVKEYVEGWEDSPWIMGWWSDNEINETVLMLDFALVMDPTDEKFVYTYVTAWEWFKQRTGKDNPTMLDLTDEIRDDYREFVYDRYLSVMRRCFKKYAPNHLFFGNRQTEFSVDSPGIFRAMARHCDVISINLYRFWEPDIVAYWQEWVDKPVIITEWYGRPEANVNKKGFAGGFVLKNSEDCGKFYQNYALRLLEGKNIVGYNFFTAVIGEEQENYMREFNPNIYSLIDFFDERNR